MKNNNINNNDDNNKIKIAIKLMRIWMTRIKKAIIIIIINGMKNNNNNKDDNKVQVEAICAPVPIIDTFLQEIKNSQKLIIIMFIT